MNIKKRGMSAKHASLFYSTEIKGINGIVSSNMTRTLLYKNP